MTSGGYRRVSYSDEEIQALRLDRVHFLGNYLVCNLANGQTLCVPLRVSAALLTAGPYQRSRWQIVDDGRTLTWPSSSTEPERLSLRTMLGHPDARIGDAADPDAPWLILPAP